MTVTLQIRHQARIDLLGHMEFLYERNPDASARFYKAVRATYEQLLLHPQLGTRYDVTTCECGRSMGMRII
jgi:plasmid stabilization system protein ParE